MYKYISIILMILLLICSFLLYQEKQRTNYLEAITEKQSSENALLKLERDDLVQSITNQNKTIEQYKKDTKTFQKQLEELNNALENELQNKINFEKIENNNASEKEVIEWLKSKCSSLSF